MSQFDSPLTLAGGNHSSPLSRVRKRLANLVTSWRTCGKDHAGALPEFSLREWADLPTHHPASDE